jgi:hypothetical protein
LLAELAFPFFRSSVNVDRRKRFAVEAFDMHCVGPRSGIVEALAYGHRFLLELRAFGPLRTERTCMENSSGQKCGL